MKRRLGVWRAHRATLRLLGVCILLVASSAFGGCIDGGLTVPPIRDGATASYHLDGRLVTGFNGYGDPDTKADRALLLVAASGGIDVFTSEGVVSAVRFAYRLMAGDWIRLGADYIREDRGQVAYVSHRTAPQEPGSQDQHAWDTGLPDALLSTLFAGRRIHAGGGSFTLPTAPWREYATFGQDGLRYAAQVKAGLATVTIETTAPPLAERVSEWTLSFDSACPFPESVVVRTRDGSPGMELHRQSCHGGAGEPFQFGLGRRSGGQNPSLLRGPVADASAGMDDVAIDGFRAATGRSAVEASTAYLESCRAGCSLVAARYTETTIPPALPIGMKPKSAQQWGFWYQSGNEVVHLVAERTNGGIEVRAGRDASRISPLTSESSEVRFLMGDEIVPAALKALQADAPRVGWRVAALDASSIRLLDVDGGLYDQTQRDGAVRVPSAGLTLAWSSAREGFLLEYIGRLDVEPGP